MVKTITIHSHKGGAGKSSTTMNLGAVLAEKGYRVAVIDLDLNAPSLQTYAPGRSEKKINSLFLRESDIEDIFFDATYLIDKEIDGKLFLALADIFGDVISKMGNRSKDDLLNDLYLLMGIVKNQLPDDPWNADYILIDTPPGLSTTSINGVATADHLLLLLHLINADINGSYHMLKTIHRTLRPKTSLIVNQIPHSFVEKDGIQRIRDLIQNRIIDHLDNKNIEFLGIIENDEKLIEMELEYAFSEVSSPEELTPRPIHCMKFPDGIFAKYIRNIAESLIE